MAERGTFIVTNKFQVKIATSSRVTTIYRVHNHGPAPISVLIGTSTLVDTIRGGETVDVTSTGASPSTLWVVLTPPIDPIVNGAYGWFELLQA